ncbi:uncharacterized protein METZ01_LOCUS435819 [marine metagenome]|uniref:Uncharacterized protein n=1 Tax=marine metagenome TaxID=408172 RepID=A0A382YJD7_9ZZZZ
MIVDVHSHVWRFPEDFSEDFRRQAVGRAKADSSLDLEVKYEAYRAGIPDGERSPRSFLGAKRTSVDYGLTINTLPSALRIIPTHDWDFCR